MSKAIVLFGELLMRLGTEGNSRFVQADRLAIHYTGGEANAGVSLAAWGHAVKMVSRVPANDLGQACLNHLRRYGLDTSLVQRGGERLGLFFVETGVGARPSRIIYDRRHSAFTEFSDATLDWPEVFAGADWFHFTGTAPAVAERMAPLLQRACAAAKAQGAVVSCDLNYRSQLWSPDEAGRVMTQLLTQVDVLVCGVDDAARLFGIVASADQTGAQAAAEIARRLRERFSLTHVAVPLRDDRSASHSNYAVLLQDGSGSAQSRTYEITAMVDRIGAGDAKMAGLIHGLRSGWTLERTAEFAAAAACLKHGIPGDFNHVSVAEVDALAAGTQSGRIQR